MIPIPVINGHAYLFNLDHVKELREKHHITGVLVGILSQFPQQNVFMGLPVQLMPEETKFLVDEKIGFLVDDTEYHQRYISSKSTSSEPAEEPLQVSIDTPGHDQDTEQRVETLGTRPVHYNGPDTATFLMFKYLNENGMYCMPGLRFGCQFLAYPGDPLRYHAHFNSRGLEWDEKFDVLDVIGCGRLATAVKKCWVVGAEDPEGDYRAFSIEWAAFG